MSYCFDVSTVLGQDMASVLSDPASDQSKQTLENLKISHKKWRHKESSYDVFKYMKNYMTRDSYPEAGWFRSLIAREGEIVCVAPPKAVSPDDFNVDLANVRAEEFVDGVMINMFWDKSAQEWELATRSSVGGKVSFFTDSDGAPDASSTFRYMFLDAANSIQSEGEGDWFDKLDKSIVYSFVLQHPNHRIVTPVGLPHIWLVAAYRIVSPTKIESIKFTDEFKSTLPEGMYWPSVFAEAGTVTSLNSIKEKYASINCHWRNMGVVLIDETTGLRTKFRNPNYEDIRRLRGNQPKLQFHYLTLRREQGAINRYLAVFPEHRAKFSDYREQVYKFTDELYRAYVRAFVRKEVAARDLPYQVKCHAHSLHERYINNLRAVGSYIDKRAVIGYVNGLPAERLMYSMNWTAREWARSQRANRSSASQSPVQEGAEQDQQDQEDQEQTLE